MAQTALQAKLEAKGILAKTVALDVALSVYVNNGGTFVEGLERLCSAFRLNSDGVRALLAVAAQHYDRNDAGRFVAFDGKGSEGHQVRAEKGHSNIANASRQNDGEKGRADNVDKASEPVSSSPSPQNGAGHTLGADKAKVDLPRSVPGHAKRGLAAIASVQEAMSKSLFDTTKLPDGRSLREVRWHECPHIAARYSRVSRIVMAIHNRAVPVDPDATLDSLVSEDGLQEIISTVEKLNDIH